MSDPNKERHWRERQKTLAKAIEDWANSEAESDLPWGDHEPWLGDETYHHMATAAIAVLRAMRDSEDHRDD